MKFIEYYGMNSNTAEGICLHFYMVHFIYQHMHNTKESIRM